MTGPTCFRGATGREAYRTLKKIAVLSPVAWRTPPKQYGAWETVASNIAEGCGRMSTGEYRQSLGMARGSNFELQTQIEIVRALGFSDSKMLEEAEGLSFEVGKMISGVLNSIKDKQEAKFPNPQPYIPNH